MHEVYPVRFFAAVLYSSKQDFELCLQKLVSEFGPADYISPEAVFDVTDYYKKEMGAPLYRVMVSFEKSISPSLLPDIKLTSIAIEDSLKKPAGRTVNIDSGYMDYDKVVLASTKSGPYKIYMDKGIWADMTLHYEKGTFLPFPWTFADFKDGRYNKYLLHIRELYKKSNHS